MEVLGGRREGYMIGEANTEGGKERKREESNMIKREGGQDRELRECI